MKRGCETLAALGRAAADAVIGAPARALGGERNGEAMFAVQFGAHPDITSEWMQGARRAVADLYVPSCGG